MMNKELKAEAKSYAKRKFSEEEQAYLHDIITQAYLAGAEPREKRIVELEMTVGTLRTFSNEQATCIERLQKENAELDCQKNRNKSCYSCANATERCFRNEIGCPCQKYKSYKDENTELKEKLEHRNCVDCSNHGSNIKLAKAKELLQEIVINKAVIKVYNPYTDDGTVQSLKIALNHWFQRAEQFLKE